MAESLAGRVALVTGGGSGIGRAACRAFALAAPRWRSSTSDPSRLTSWRARSPRTGARRRPRGRCRRRGEHRAGRRRDGRPLRGLHIVFANAGVNGMRAPIDELELAEWRATIDTNLSGTFLTVKHAIPHLRASGGGSVVVTASLNGTEVFSSAGFAAYSTSKAGQVAFARMAAFECARWGIRVNAILPGSIETAIEERTARRNLDRIPYEVGFPAHYPPLHGRRGTPDEVAALALFLVSDASRYLTGAAIPIDAGVSLVRG